LIHGLHEFDFVIGVVAFTCGRIDLPPTFPSFLAPVLATAAFQSDGNLPFAAIIPATVGNAKFRWKSSGCGGLLAHDGPQIGGLGGDQIGGNLIAPIRI